VLHNFIINEGLTNKVLEVQDLELLANVDEELTKSREIVQNNITD